MFFFFKQKTAYEIVDCDWSSDVVLFRSAPYVNGKGWEYDVYIDPNGDFKRALGVNNVPHTFLVDGNGNVVWQHNSYNEGDEYELFELVKKLSEGKTIN